MLTHSEKISHPKAREIRQILLWIASQLSCVQFVEIKHYSLLTPQCLEQDRILSLSRKGTLQEADYKTRAT